VGPAQSFPIAKLEGVRTLQLWNMLRQKHKSNRRAPFVAPRRYVQSNLSVARQTTRYETAEL